MEPHLGNFLDNDGIGHGNGFLDNLLNDFLVVLHHGDALGQTPLAVLLADVPGKTGRDTEVAVQLVVQLPTLIGALLHVSLAVESVTDEGAADVEHEVEPLGETELVRQAQVEGGAGNIAFLLEAVNETTTGVSINRIEAIRLVTAENVHQVGMSQGVGVHEPAVLDSKFVVIPLGITRRIGNDRVLLEIAHRAEHESGRVSHRVLGIGLIQTLELAGGNAETHTEARGGPLGQIQVDGREGDHLRPLGDFPVVVTIIEVRAHAGAEFPVVPETVRENGILGKGGRRDDLAGRRSGFLDDGLEVVILARSDLHLLGESGCRRNQCDRSKQNK